MVAELWILHCFAMWSPFLYPSKKSLSFPFSLGQKRIYLQTQLKGECTVCFENCQGVSCSHRQNKNRMLNTFIIVIITHTGKR